MRRIIAPSQECAESPQAFLPAFCPNPGCSEHRADRKPRRKQIRWFVRNGSYRADPAGLKQGFAVLLDAAMRLPRRGTPLSIHSDCKREYAVVAGIDERWVGRRLSQLFAWREFLSRLMVTTADRSVWLRQLQTPLKRRGEFLPRFASD